MEWFEPIIIVVAILLVIVPFYIHFRNAFKKKNGCSCGCSECGKKCECFASFKKYANDVLNKSNQTKESKQ